MEDLVPYLEQYSYAGIFLGLLLCGLGLPIPEEVFLISGGLLVHGVESYKADFWLMTLTAMSSIMLGDSLAFWIGKHHTDRIYRIPLIRKMLGSEKQQSWIQNHFNEHPWKTIFVARFLAGVRAPTFFFAGGHGVPYWKFFFADFLGALISVPTSIWAAWYLGENKERAFEVVHQFHMWVLGVVLCAVAGFFIWLWRRRRRRKTEEAAKDATEKSEML